MTDQPQFGEKAPEPAPRKPMTAASWVLGIFMLVIITAVITPFIIALWRWAFAQ